MFVFLLLVHFVHAIEVLPVEIIEAPALDVFSDRAEIWPSEKVYTDYTVSDQSLYDSIGKFSTIGSRGDLSGGSPHFSIRGSSESARTLVLYNGIPLNVLDGLGAGSLLLPQETTHSIYALKGPSSVLYGSDAVGGAINIIPYTYTRGVIRAGVGSFGRRSLYAAAPILKKEDHKLQLTSFTNFIDGDFPYESNGTESERRPNHLRMGRMTLSGSHKLSGFSLNETLIYAESFGATPGPVDAPYVTQFNRKSLLGSFTVQKNIAARDTITLRSTGVYNEFFNTDFSTTRWYSGQLSESASYKKTFSDQVNGEFFLDYFYDEFENKPNTRFLSDTRFEPGIILNYAPDQTYFISPGLRYVPDVGLLIKSIIMGQDQLGLRTWISYSEGYRNPSFTQKYFQSALFNGNPSLKPEKSDQVELGFSKKQNLNSQNIFERIAFEASVYTTNYTDFIEYTGGTPSSYRNAGALNIFGFDISTGLNYAIWSTQVSYSYIEPDAPINLTPKQKWSLVIGAQLGPVIAEAVQTHWNPYNLTNTDKTGSWDVFDLNIRTIGLSDWTVKASVQNIFDNKRQFTLNYPEPGRQFLASVERTF